MMAGLRRLFRLTIVPVLALAVLGCNMTSGLVSSPRTPTEQLLLTQSLLRSLDQISLPLFPGATVTIDTAWPPTHADFGGDLTFAASVLTSWFAQQGAVIGGAAPTYRVRVLLHAFGLEKQDVFFGIPPIQSLLIPFALPELTLYRNVRNRGYTRLSIEIADAASGRLVGAPSVAEATVSHQRYTLLFLLSWQTTDLMPPPL
ncbi:hypothetical protein [Nitrospira moscoviensis]|uniref:Uncharacterized protein n=1 Tax=Nitrospira moscoviensis TaxID=42253 RepID=A0A0K2GE36_NITMO|nr:hypothetical protein [Nitrospira moscoviensis]ALA59119.1 conserved exported protein of unknown function [Nitrospira moscoviensis]